jgi:hypothetical protein
MAEKTSNRKENVNAEPRGQILTFDPKTEIVLAI